MTDLDREVLTKLTEAMNALAAALAGPMGLGLRIPTTIYHEWRGPDPYLNTQYMQRTDLRVR